MNRKTFKRWLPLIALAVLICGVYVSGIHNTINLDTFQDQKESLLSYARDHFFLAIIFFTGVYFFAVALSLPVATLLTLLGGFLFGRWIGTLLVVFGATAGATALFLIAKGSLGETLREKAGTFYSKAEKNMQDNAVGYLLFLRLVPVFPFFLVNIVPALFNIPLRIFVLTTFFGIMPGTFVFVNVGQALGEINALDDLVSGKILFAFGLLGLFALIPTLYKQYRSRKTGGEKKRS